MQGALPKGVNISALTNSTPERYLASQPESSHSIA